MNQESYSKGSGMSRSVSTFEEFPDAKAPISEMINYMRKQRADAMNLIKSSNNFYTPPEKKYHKNSKGLFRRSLTKSIRNEEAVDIDSITEKEILRIVQ